MEHYISRTKHNEYEIKIANDFAINMYKKPSPLEQRMQLFLDNNGIDYEFQKIIYILDKSGSIIKFFIADFYIPKGNVIIETDGKFHEKQQDYDTMRNDLIISQNPGIGIIRWTWHDFDNPEDTDWLLKTLKERANTNTDIIQYYIEKSTKYVDNEQFIFVFNQFADKIKDLKGTEINVLLCCWRHSELYNKADNGNVVYNNRYFKELCHRDGLKACNSSIDKAIGILSKKDLLIKRCVGDYLLNPYYFFKGKLSDRNKAMENPLIKQKLISA